MSDKIKNPRGAGRKIAGSEAKTERIQTRLEPWIIRRVENICQISGISMSEAVRQALLLYVNETEKNLKSGG